ncbi:MAG: class I SAM-dependent methyltransferase [Candidatus Acidiferrales bacterium]
MADPKSATDSKERFSNRVEDYVRYRPGYPREILDVLREGCGLTAESVVVDVGSGTGLLAQLFLENGNIVYGVEPNAAMRDAGEQFLEKYRHFCSVAGSAEATTLPDACADFVVAGQAFHWFEPKATRVEFVRVLRPARPGGQGGWVAVMWNERVSDRTAFQREYEQLLRAYCDEYTKVAETYPQYERMNEFFGRGAFGEKLLPNAQVFDFDGLSGRLRSSSYAPPQGHPKHEPMLAALRKLFDAHVEDGRVRFEYETHVYYGRLEAGGDS